MRGGESSSIREARSPSGTGRRATGPLVAVALVVVGAAVSWFRLPEAARQVPWAEDGGLFLQQWLIGPGWHVFTPYDGYLQVVPRIIVGAIASFAPPAAFAVVVTAACCVVVGCLTAVVWACTGDLVRSPVVRVVLALLTVAAPAAGTEVLGNVANLHWYLFWVTFWVVLHRPLSWLGAGALAVLALLAALSEIQVALLVLLLPTARRHPRQLVVHLALALGVVVQVVVTLNGRRPDRSAAEPSVLSVVEGWLAGPVLSTVTGGFRVQGSIVAAVGLWAPLLLMTALAAALVVVWRAGDPRPRVAAVACVAAAGALFTAASWVNFSPFLDYRRYDDADWSAWASDRYAVLPGMLLLATVLLAADALVSRSSRRGGRRAVAGGAVLALVSVVLLINLRPSSTARDGAEPWPSVVARAEQRCARSREVVNLAVAPSGTRVTLSCEQLQDWER